MHSLGNPSSQFVALDWWRIFDAENRNFLPESSGHFVWVGSNFFFAWWQPKKCFGRKSVPSEVGRGGLLVGPPGHANFSNFELRPSMNRASVSFRFIDLWIVGWFSYHTEMFVWFVAVSRSTSCCRTTFRSTSRNLAYFLVCSISLGRCVATFFLLFLCDASDRNVFEFPLF